MFFGVFLWFSCVSNQAELLAVKTCEAMPTLVIDAVGHSLLSTMVDPTEYDLWSTSIKGTVVEEMTPALYGVIRSNSKCHIGSIDEQGQILLTRLEPEWAVMEPLEIKEIMKQPLVERQLTYQLIYDDGKPRIHIDLERALKEAQAAQMLLERGEIEASIEAWSSLHKWFADPTVLWKIQNLKELL